MPTGSQIRRLLEGTYDNLNPQAVKLLEAVEQKHGFQSAKNFLNTLATDYDLVPKRGGNNDNFDEIAGRVWKRTTGTDLPDVSPDRLERVQGSLDRLREQFPENLPATVPKAVGGYELPAKSGAMVPSATSGSRAISKSPFDIAVDTTYRDMGSVRARGDAPLQLEAAAGGGGGGKSPALTAAAAGGAYAVGRALTDDDEEEKAAGAKAGPPAPDLGMGPPSSAAKPPNKGGGTPPPLPDNSDILKGIGKFTSSDAPGAEEFGLTKEGADYKGVDAERTKLEGTQKDARMEYMRQTNALAEELKTEKDSLRQRQIFEKLSQALGHLAAGWLATKTGAYVPVMEFKDSDWAGERQGMINEYVAKERTAAGNYGAYKDQLEASGRNIDRREAQIVRQWEGNQKLYDTALNTWRAKEDSRFRDWQSTMETAKLKLTERGQADDLKFKYANLDATRTYYEGLIDTAKDKNTINAARTSLKTANDAEKVLGNFRKALTAAAKAKTSGEAEGKFNEAVGLAQQYKTMMGGDDLITQEEINSADPGPVIERLMGAAAAGPRNQQVEDAKAWLQDNPDDPRADGVRARIRQLE
jgi:hypothetical protein